MSLFPWVSWEGMFPPGGGEARVGTVFQACTEPARPPP